MRLYQFYAAATGSPQIQMVSNGNIVGVWWTVNVAVNSSLASVVAELSYSSANQTAVHNPNGVISFFTGYQGYGTNVGYAQTTFCANHLGLYCPVRAGDLIYLNCTITTGALLKAMLHVQEGK